MNYAELLALSIATSALVFLRAWQQQNVFHQYYWWAAVTSYGIAIADVTVVIGVVSYGMVAIPFIGTGGAIGVVCAMALHKRIRG